MWQCKDIFTIISCDSSHSRFSSPNHTVLATQYVHEGAAILSPLSFPSSLICVDKIPYCTLQQIRQTLYVYLCTLSKRRIVLSLPYCTERTPKRTSWFYTMLPFVFLSYFKTYSPFVPSFLSGQLNLKCKFWMQRAVVIKKNLGRRKKGEKFRKAGSTSFRSEILKTL